jgi:hypothetical protein
MYQEAREEDRQLKKIALTAASKHLEVVLASESFCALCKKIGDIGLGFLKTSVDGKRDSDWIHNRATAFPPIGTRFSNELERAFDG